MDVITLTQTFEKQDSILWLRRLFAHKTVIVLCFRIHDKHLWNVPQLKWVLMTAGECKGSGLDMG